MPIETFDKIDSLNVSNPVATDPEGEGDDHIRGIKAVLKNTFPNITAAVTATAAQLNQLASGIIVFAAGSVGSPSIIIGDAASAFYRSAAGAISVIGRLNGDGAIDEGSMHFFCRPPVGGMAVGGTATGTERYVLTDGSVYNIATFPKLGAYLGSAYGGNGTTTFGMPNLIDTNRFIRAAGGSLAVGSEQSNAIKSHTAPVSGTADDHTHGFSGADGASLGGITSFLTLTPTGAPAGALNVGTSVQVGSVTLNAGSFSGNTGGASAHGVSGTATYTGATETRPESFAAYICLKT